MGTAGLLVLLLLAPPEKPPERVNRLALDVALREEYSTFCGLECWMGLYARRGGPRFHASGERPPLVLELVADGSPARSAALPADASVEAGEGGPSGGMCWRVKVDLRDAFGPFKPGRYTLRVRHPAEGYSVDIPDFVAAPIESAPVSFTVREATLEDARATTKSAWGVEFRVEKGMGVVTNRRKMKLTFSSYPEADGVWFPPVAYEHWTGRAWIMTGPGPNLDTRDLRPRDLPPGASIRFALPSHRDGIVRYSILLRSPTGMEARAVSEPAIVTAPKK